MPKQIVEHDGIASQGSRSIRQTEKGRLQRSGTGKVRKDTIQQKKKLRHVDDPDTISKRQLKREKILLRKKNNNNNKKKKNHKKKKKSADKGGGGNNDGGGGGFSQDAISAQRAKLNHVHVNR